MSYSRWSALLSRTPGQQPPPECYDRWLSEVPKPADYADHDAWLTDYLEWKEHFLETNELELAGWYSYHDAPRPHPRPAGAGHLV